MLTRWAKAGYDPAIVRAIILPSIKTDGARTLLMYRSRIEESVLKVEKPAASICRTLEAPVARGNRFRGGEAPISSRSSVCQWHR